MGGHLKQCDIFREIANMWRNLPLEEKQPYINEVRTKKVLYSRRTKTRSEKN